MAGRLRAVLVGCGRISVTWLRAAQTMPDLEVVGLVDVRPEAAEERAAQFGLREAMRGTDANEVLRWVRPDVVFNCTAPEAHLEVALVAFRHGCHVLSEKPLAHTMAAAERLVEAARSAGRICAVTQNRRYQRQIRQLRAIARSGALGRLTTVDSDHYVGNHFGGFRETMQHALLLDMAIHTFDAARCITGEEPVEVYCREWNPHGSWYAHGASAVAMFELTGSVVYTYRGSWCSEGLNTSADAAWRLIGDQGSATWDSFEHIAAEVVEVVGGYERTGRLTSQMRALPAPPPEDDATTRGHASVMREFLDCVRTGATPETTAEDNIKSLAMVFAAIESAESGRAVAIGA